MGVDLQEKTRSEETRKQGNEGTREHSVTDVWNNGSVSWCEQAETSSELHAVKATPRTRRLSPHIVPTDGHQSRNVTKLLLPAELHHRTAGCRSSVKTHQASDVCEHELHNVLHNTRPRPASLSSRLKPAVG